MGLLALVVAAVLVLAASAREVEEDLAHKAEVQRTLDGPRTSPRRAAGTLDLQQEQKRINQTSKFSSFFLYTSD